MYFFYLLAARLPQTIFPVIDTYQACFTPAQSCAVGLVQHIKSAKQSIKVQCFYLSSRIITDALLEAKKRGISVEVVADRDQVYAPYSTIGELSAQNIPLYIETTVNMAHNKIIIIDDKIVLTGSYNLTANAEHSNAENILMIADQTVVLKYVNNFTQRKQKSCYLAYLKFKEVKANHTLDAYCKAKKIIGSREE